MNATLSRNHPSVLLNVFAALREYRRCLAIVLLLRLIVPAFASEPPITAVAFSPGGDTLAATSQSGLQLYSWPDLTRKDIIQTSAANLHCLSFSPGAERLAVGGGFPAEEGIAQVFSWPGGKPIVSISRHEDSIFDVAWKITDGSAALLTASLDHDIKLVDLEKRTTTTTFAGHSRGVRAVCLLQDGKTLVSAGDDQSLRVWNTESGELIRIMNQHTGPVHDLALRESEQGLPMIASAAGDRTIRFWQPTIGRMVRYVRLESEPLAIAWLSDRVRIAAGCVDGHVRVIDANEVKVIDDRPAIDGWAYAIAVHPGEDSIVVAGSGGEIKQLVP